MLIKFKVIKNSCAYCKKEFNDDLNFEIRGIDLDAEEFIYFLGVNEDDDIEYLKYILYGSIDELVKEWLHDQISTYELEYDEKYELLVNDYDIVEYVSDYIKELLESAEY